MADDRIVKIGMEPYEWLELLRHHHHITELFTQMYNSRGIAIDSETQKMFDLFKALNAKIIDSVNINEVIDAINQRAVHRMLDEISDNLNK